MLSRFFNSSKILLYHRITNTNEDPQLLNVSKNNFRTHMKYLKDNYHILKLSDLVDNFRNSKIDNNSVVITFDDGYADNLYNAKPILHEFNIPAVVFITTEMIGERKEFWWDTLERLILLSPILPLSLSIMIKKNKHFWNLNDSTNSKSFNSQLYKNWHIGIAKTPTVRHKLYRDLYYLLYYLDHFSRQDVLDQLSQWSGANNTLQPVHHTMTATEVRDLFCKNLIEIGGHTHTHPILKYLTYLEQLSEIKECKIRLETIINSPIKYFSYPFGSKYHYNRNSIKAVKAAGFTSACSNFEGKIGWWANQYELPRFIVRNWNREEFVTQIKRF